MTPFGAILQRAVETTPGAIGGAFADSQGEMIDSFALGDAHEWAVLTATYGVVMSQLRRALGTWHYGGPEYFIAQHSALDVVVHAIDGGYFALLAVAGAPFAIAIARVRVAAAELLLEMS